MLVSPLPPVATATPVAGVTPRGNDLQNLL